MSTHGPISPEYHAKMNALAKIIDEFFNGHERPRKTGFAVLVFPFDIVDQDRVNYISNADRKDMLVAMKEFITRNEGFDPSEGGRA